MGFVVSIVTSTAPQAPDSCGSGTLPCASLGAGMPGGFLGASLAPSVLMSRLCLLVLRAGFSPHSRPSPVVLCWCARRVLCLLCDCGGRGKLGSPGPVRKGLSTRTSGTGLSWSSQEGSVHQNLRNGALRKGPLLASLLAPRMPSWERSHLTSTTRHCLSMITFLEPRFSTN